jgi:hypothetical protein
LVSSGGTSAGRSAALSVVAQVPSKSGGIVPVAAVEAALVDSPPELGGGADEPDPPHAGESLAVLALLVAIPGESPRRFGPRRAPQPATIVRAHRRGSCPLVARGVELRPSAPA